MGIIKRLGNRPETRPRVAARMYHSAKQSRLTSGWGQSNTSADSELSTSLTMLRTTSRMLVRDAAFAKRAKVVVQNNVVGSGIGMQGQVKTSAGTLNQRINDAIEDAWHDWQRAPLCHTGGTLHFADFERASIGQVFEAGEVFVRLHFSPFGYSSVPLALELIEPERIADEFQPSALDPDAKVRMGIETDRYHRPVAYWIRTLHPGELRLTAQETSRLERVPADQIIHLRLVDRWPQTRGEPWLHAVARKLNDMDGYSEAEIIAARGAASYMATIETDDGMPLGSVPAVGDGSAGGADTGAGTGREITLEPGVVERLSPGEKFNFHSPNRPNPNMDPFMRMMLREVAAGVGVSYESLSRDYSQSNYSASRLALLDDRDLWRMLQGWFIRNFRDVVHCIWLQQAVLARAISAIRVEEYALNPGKYEAVRFKPRGWSWIDPTKEVAAYKEAVKAGFKTVSDVISETGAGRDIEDVLEERDRELKLMAEKGLKFDTDPQASAAPPNPPPDDDPPDDEEGEDDASTDEARPRRVFSFPR
jgi:lambda family phage portal protein